MRWQIEVALQPDLTDSLGVKIRNELRWLGLEGDVRVTTARLFLLMGDVDARGAEEVARDLLTDPVIESYAVSDWESYDGSRPASITVFKKPGVMDPSEANILRGAACVGQPLEAVKSATRYSFEGVPDHKLEEIGLDCLANEAVEAIQVGCDRFPPDATLTPYAFERIEVPLSGVDDASLVAISEDGGLSLSLDEMRTIQDHFREIGREPTDIELETLAQTWSEHCKHKTFTFPINYRGPAVGDLEDGARIPNLLKATVKHVTDELDREFCLSVFHDNAGVIAFDDEYGLSFKVETHNHPSAIEPYGGAGTGIGGVIRDILGTGLGAHPVANTDVFCVGPLDLPAEDVPKGALHPLRVLRGVVSGVRDYGNQMGIPTVSGGVFFDPRYIGNPLVYAGTVGLIPRDKVDKEVLPGDAIVTVGGRTGRDGIHGATFSSVELHEESETVDSGAVQIGNAITEKKVMDVVLEARDRGLFRAITDCGAGGFSSAVGEMGEHTGARVDLEQAPLKYAGLSYTEIWISEAQERMVLAVQPENLDAFLELCRSEDVESVVLGTFTDTGRLELFYEGSPVADLSMAFLHDGLPEVSREATFSHPEPEPEFSTATTDLSANLLEILGSPNVASKEWIIRQYDHEVQGASAVKALVGTRAHGPSDGSVLAPIFGNPAGFAVGLGMNPLYGDLDPYQMAMAAVDEALRNVVSVGGDPGHCAVLDNFSWGNCNKPDRLGGLVRAAYGCRDAALALGTPFISGKDSLNNEYRVGDKTIVIPPSLLISAIAKVPDVREAVTMDLKAPANHLYVVGTTADEMGGSHYMMIHGRRGNAAPALDGEAASRTFSALHGAMRAKLVRSCHDMSEGGLAVCAAEMVMAGEVGARIRLADVPATKPDLADTRLMFSESLSRFLVEVDPRHASAFEQALAGVPCKRVGETADDDVLIIEGRGGKQLVSLTARSLEQVFRPALTRHLEGGSEVTHA